MNQKEDFQKWLKFLLYINAEQKNRELITHYFLSKFSHSPSLFFTFVQFVKEELSNGYDEMTKKNLANSILEILCPICERFGFFEEKRKIDDMCFNILEPEKFARIESKLKEYKEKEEDHIHEITTKIEEILKKNKQTANVTGRYKNIYSINRKLQKKDSEDVFQLNDIFAFRIVLENTNSNDCFDVLDTLHDHFTPLVDYFKDYITIPKINGYQALHTGLTNVIEDLDLPIEVQIRTKAMDDFAEKGLAAHWLYSREKKSRLLSDKEAKMMSFFSHLSEHDDTEQYVYFFSHTGDMFKLERGASIIDFAYQIHTNIGSNAVSALVNNKPETLYYRITEGDKVKVVTSSEKTVSPEWIRYARSKGTHKKISESLQ